MTNPPDATVPDPDRRAVLAAGAGMLALPSFALRAAAAAPGGGASGAGGAPRSLIVVWLDGGMSHLETFDPKPEAPADVRGPLAARETVLDGVRISAELPGLAERLDRCVLVRNLTHNEANHDRGSHYLLTGHRPSPVVVHPSLGAHLAASADASSGMPPFVAVPTAPAAAGAGFLPASAAPYAVGGDPGRPGFSVRGLEPDGPVARRGLELLDRLDRVDGAPRAENEAQRDALRRRAAALRDDERVRAAFDLDAEPVQVRGRYGRHRLGQSCLLARKLAACGARCVLVHDTGWDHHSDIDRAMTYGFPPKLTALDQALSALLDDLERTGLDERVTVLVASEFGRTPRLNPRGGRDHWPRAQSVLLAGAGLRRGTVLGATDARGEEPDGAGVSPADLAATLAEIQGLDPDSSRTTAALGRPIPLVGEGGRAIREILA